jgi:hypothetical protein
MLCGGMVTVTYSGADSISLTGANITLNKTDTANGAVNVTGAGNSTRTVTISGITGDGTLGISIAAGTASDSVGNTALASGASTTFTVDNTFIKGDFNQDGNPDLIWRNASTGEISLWYMDGINRIGQIAVLPYTVPSEWKIAATNDFNNDGKTDILWQNSTTGEAAYWYMNNTTQLGYAYLMNNNTMTGYAYFPTLNDQSWKIVGIKDMNGDNKPDIIWRNTVTGTNAVWYMDNATMTGYAYFDSVADQSWKIVGK